jgi:hypothetical protein
MAVVESKYVKGGRHSNTFLKIWVIDPLLNILLTESTTTVTMNPSNCRWATPTEQAVNKQHYLGKEYTWAGKTQALVGWSKDLGMSCGVLRWRIMVQGWPLERAFTKPIQQHCRRKVQNAKARIQPSL